VGESLNHMYRNCTGKCTEADFFTACAKYLSMYRSGPVPKSSAFVRKVSCTELDLPLSHTTTTHGGLMLYCFLFMSESWAS